MAVKLTKNELKKQKDQLRQFERYLPTLQLKKQQLQLVIRQVVSELEEREKERKGMTDALEQWVAVFAENPVLGSQKDIGSLVVPQSVVRGTENIAGVRVPVFENLVFADVDYPVEDYPLWVDSAVEKLKEIARLDALVKVLKDRVALLENELRATSQRVNLFEKIRIPRTRDNIRKIGIYLGDQQTSAVVRGKIAKNKIHGAGL